MRLTPRLLVFGVALVLLPLALVLLLSRVDLPSQVEADTRRALEDQTILLAAWAAPRFTSRPATLQAELVALTQHGLRYTLIAADGTVLADSSKDPAGMEPHGNRPEVVAAREGGLGWATRTSATLGRTMAYVARRVDDASGTPIGYARAALAAERVEDRGARLTGWITRASWIALVVGGLLTWFLARRLVQRIHRIRDAGLAIVAGDTARRVERAGNDELGDVGGSLNAMAAHFADQVATISAERQGLQSILAAMVEGVIAVDAEERIVHCNASAGRILGFDPATAIGQRVWEVVRLGRIPQALHDAFAAGRPAEQSVTIMRDGQMLALRIHTTPLPRRSRTTAPRGGAVVVVHDVTELRRLETVRRDFVANASHELKTPVAAIRGLVETVLDDGEMDPEVRAGFLGRIRTQATRLQGLIEEMLALSRLEAHGGRDPDRSIDVRGPAQEAFEAVAPLAAEKGIGFTREIADEALVVRGHNEALRRIAANLLDNAVKYTQARGHVHLDLRRDGDDVLLVVQDDGQGIAPEQRGRVFERFYRVDAGRAREQGGTGLGLAIVKHLVQSLGGEVHIVDVEGPGTRFEVRLPIAV